MGVYIYTRRVEECEIEGAGKLLISGGYVLPETNGSGFDAVLKRQPNKYIRI